MSIISRTASVDMLTTSAMSMPSSVIAAADHAGHDDGLCHDHHWARDVAAERRSFPRVADAARIATPSSTLHDDIHYAS